MSKVVAYARVSTDKQFTDNQLFEIKTYLARDGRRYDEAVIETVSGTKQVRDRELGRLIERLDKGDTLIVSETSRISRRLTEIFATIQQLIDREVTVIAVKQNFVFADDINSKVIAFAFGLAAEIERDLISSRTREALALRKHQGVKLGRPAGTYYDHHRKLHGKEVEIQELLKKQVPVSVIGRIYNVNRETARRFIHDKQLRDRSLL